MCLIICSVHVHVSGYYVHAVACTYVSVRAYLTCTMCWPLISPDCVVNSSGGKRLSEHSLRSVCNHC